MKIPPAEHALFEEVRLRAAKLRAGAVRGRYAPSPSGPLHLGNARTGLLAWLQTRLSGGAFVLRMEDLDRPRSRAGSAAGIMDDLRWLGLDWDEGPDTGGPLGPYDQGRREGLYREALRRLTALDRVYPCFCSRRDIQQAASAPHGAQSVYPGTCRDLDESAVAQRRETTGRAPAWRFRLPDRRAEFHDILIGPVTQELAREVGDFVVRRTDALYAYQLAVVIDDALMGITDVVRGADLLDSTPRQIELFHALELPVPRFWHVPLMFDDHGQRLAKRDGSQSIAQFRDGGGSAARLVGMLAASVGLVDSGSEVTPSELLQSCDLDRFKRVLRRRRAGDGQPDVTTERQDGPA